MFTDINAAIEEARFRKSISAGNYVVLQRSGGLMIVKDKRRGDKPMCSTENDGRGTVNTDGVRV